jgi:SNF2 family DNA or RNA helicase
VVYHGRHRQRDLTRIPTADVVLSTYQTVAIESSNGTENRGEKQSSPLLDVAWFRVVLDEGKLWSFTPKRH